LVYSANEVKYEFQILNAVTSVNEKQKLHLVNKIKRYYNNDLAGKHFAIWGLAFKPNTDDIREAPALEIINALVESGATVAAFDPEAINNVKAAIGDKITYAETQYDCLENADALIIATEWNEFRTPDFDKIISLLKDAVVFDGRNLFDVEQMEKKGFHYESIGRPLVNQPKLV
jgi:UDPglucose 6-dehydrogenase